jgi:hypothetical protein
MSSQLLCPHHKLLGLSLLACQLSSHFPFILVFLFVQKFYPLACPSFVISYTVSSCEKLLSPIAIRLAFNSGFLMDFLGFIFFLFTLTNSPGIYSMVRFDDLPQLLRRESKWA